MWPFGDKNKHDIQFVDTKRSFYNVFPIQLAKDVKIPAQDVQKSKYGQFKFPHCPGMIDYAQLGYIIPSPIDIHIKANKAGVVASIGSPSRGTRGLAQPRRMDPATVDGFIELQDGVPLTPFLQELPWQIFAKGDITALLLPAVYHSPFLNDLHVWPGSVDYKKFTTVNFVFAPKRECEVHIKAGEPLLHVIPFLNKHIKGSYSPATDEQIDLTKNSIYNDDTQFYRKHLRSVKKYVLE